MKFLKQYLLVFMCCMALSVHADRYKGIFNFSGNYEPLYASSLDARSIVPYLSDLTKTNTFGYFAYKGMVVSVYNDPVTNNNGLYMLMNLPYTNSANWQMFAIGLSEITNNIANVISNSITSATNSLWIATTNLNTTTAINTTNYINSTANTTTNRIVTSTNVLWIATTNLVTISTNTLWISTTNRITSATNTLWIATTNLNTTTAINTTNFINGVSNALNTKISDSATSITNYVNTAANNTTNYANAISNALNNKIISSAVSSTNYVNGISQGLTNYVNGVSNALNDKLISSAISSTNYANSVATSITNYVNATANNTTNYINSVANTTTNRIVDATNSLWIATTNQVTASTNNLWIAVTNRITSATNIIWIATTNLNTTTAISTTSYVNSVALNTTNAITSSSNIIWIAVTNLNTATANSTTNYINAVSNGILLTYVQTNDTRIVNGATNYGFGLNGYYAMSNGVWTLFVLPESGTSTSTVQNIISQVLSTGIVLNATTVIGSQSNIIANAVTNNGIVINGITLGNGTNITITSGSANAMTNNGVTLQAGANITLNGGSTPLSLTNGMTVTIASTATGGGGGIGLSNIVINGKYGTLSGSGSNIISTVTLVPSDIGAITTNQLDISTNTLWIATTNLNTTTAINTTNYINSVANNTTNRIVDATNNLWIATTNLNTTTAINTTNYINGVSNAITSDSRFINAVTNNGIVINGITLGNGTNITITSGSANAVTNNGVILQAGANVTLNGGTSDIQLTNGVVVSIASSGTGSGNAVTNNGAYVLGSPITNGANIDFEVVVCTNGPYIPGMTITPSFAEVTNIVNLVAITNRGVILQAGANVTLNGGSSPILLTNGAVISIASSGSEITTNQLNDATNNLWITVTNLNTTTANDTTNYINSVAVVITNRIVSSTNDLWIAVTNLDTTTAINTTNYINGSINSALNGLTNQINSNTAFRINSTVYYATNSGTASNSLMLGGLTPDEVMQVGATYYFTTNEISYGAVTGRTASLAIPTVTQSVTYTGPVADGTYFASYLIKSNEMPTILEAGTYVFQFFGGHDTFPNKNPTIMGDIYIKNADTGETIQEFESEPVVIPYGTDKPFTIRIQVTNAVPKDGYAILLRTKLIDDDGYTGNYVSQFGKPNYPGFTLSRATGVYVSQAEWIADKVYRVNWNTNNTYSAGTTQDFRNATVLGIDSVNYATNAGVVIGSQSNIINAAITNFGASFNGVGITNGSILTADPAGTAVSITQYVNSVANNTTNAIISATNNLWTAVTNLNTLTAINTTNYVNNIAISLTNRIVDATNNLWIATTNLNTVTANNTTNYINAVANSTTNAIVSSTNDLWMATTNLNTRTAVNTTNYVNEVATGITNRIVDATNTLWIATTNLNATTVPTTRTITIDGITYDLSANRTWTTAAGGVTLEQVTNVASIIVTQYVDASFATRTNLYNVTGSIEVSNSASFVIPLLYSPVELADCRFYLSTTNGVPVSRRAKIAISQKANNRCSDLVYLYTNQLYYAVTSTVAGVVDTYTNVVGDASGFIINDMYYKNTSPTTWQTVSNYTSTVVAWNCSNMVNEAVGTLISHVNRFQLFSYSDRTGGTNLYVNITFNTPYTNQISYNISYYRK